MAKQRVVLTTPWKLGLFVFLLVVGCGFGLIYAYLTLLGGTLEFGDSESLQAFYIVCGSVALLGITGYLAVVTQARPMDQAQKDSRKREKLLKKLAKVDDPTDVDVDDFEGDSALHNVIERWQEDHGVATQAQMAISNQRAAIDGLITKVQSAGAGEVEWLETREDDEIAPLVSAINSILAKSSPGAGMAGSADPVGSADEVLLSVDALTQQQSQLRGFAASVASSSEELARRAQTNMSSNGGQSLARQLDSGSLGDVSRRNSNRLAQLRATLEQLAEESNRLAINAALQVSRLGESGTDLLNVTEEIRSLSTRYQRMVAELRLCEHDQELTLNELRALANADDSTPSASAGLSPDAVQKLAMVLDQNSGGLEEIASQLGNHVAHLKWVADPSQPRPTVAASRGVTPLPGASTPPMPPATETPTDHSPVDAPMAAPTSFGAMESAPPAVDPGAAVDSALGFQASAPAADSGPAIGGANGPGNGPMFETPTSPPAAFGGGASSGRRDVIDFSGPVTPVSVAPTEDDAIDLTSLGAVELPADLDAEGNPVYDLMELGAVEV